MKEKFRLRCDLNNITDIENMDEVSDKLEHFSHIEPYHRYHYLFRGYHDLVHGEIDDETFFALGDISSDKPLFAGSRNAGLETVFMIKEEHKDDTLYVVEQSARDYYRGKLGQEKSDVLLSTLATHGSALVVI